MKQSLYFDKEFIWLGHYKINRSALVAQSYKSTAMTQYGELIKEILGDVFILYWGSDYNLGTGHTYWS